MADPTDVPVSEGSNGADEEERSGKESFVELIVIVAVALGLALLIQAFVGEAIESIASDALRDLVTATAERWLRARS